MESIHIHEPPFHQPPFGGFREPRRKRNPEFTKEDILVVKEKVNTFLKWLSSIKITVILIFYIVILCIIGTIFPQGSVNSDILGHSRNIHIPDLLSPYKIFNSIWLIAAGLCLCLNMILCMRRKLKLKKRNIQILLMHGGLLFIMAGYALGSLGTDGFMQIPEGEKVSEVLLKDGSMKHLGFSIRCDSFTVEHYDNGTPKEYTSNISFLDNDLFSGQRQLRVNHPAHYSGFTFYQQSYSQSFSAKISVASGERKKEFKVKPGDIIQLSPGVQATVLKIWDNLMNAGPAVKFSVNDNSGEKVIWVFKNIKEMRGNIPEFFGRMPHFDPSRLYSFIVVLEGLETVHITGIGVRQDPGIYLAGAGGFLFFISLLFLFSDPLVGRAILSKSGGKDRHWSKKEVS